MPYNEWMRECFIPSAIYFISFFGVCGAIGYGMEKFKKNKRKIALWIGKHIYHEDWTIR